MILDELLPRYDYRERHETFVPGAPPERIYHATRNLDFRSSRVVRLLFRLRGMPAEAASLDGLVRLGFIPLADAPPTEMVFGVAGRFWDVRSRPARLSAAGFQAFDKPGTARAAFNFEAKAWGGGSLLSTETRIACADRAARRRFGVYWFFIRPFSGLIRRIWLRQIARAAAERPFGDTTRNTPPTGPPRASPRRRRE